MNRRRPLVRLMFQFLLGAVPCVALSSIAEQIGPLQPHRDGPRYTPDDWRREWPGCVYEEGVSAGRVSIARVDNTRWWRVSFAPGQIGPTEGGIGWRWPFTKNGWTSAELEYRLLFETDFQFVKGGKLPGLCGGPRTISGGMECSGYDGWSVRVMWRREGRGAAYVYHAAKTNDYGESIPFPEEYRFPVGQPVMVRLRVDMNAPGHRNGRLRVWASDRRGRVLLVVDRRDLLFTKDLSIGVDSVLFETFHGGADASWAPPQPCFVCFTAVRIRKVVGGTEAEIRPLASEDLRRPSRAAPRR